VSLCSQLAYTYSANRQASFPFSLIYTSLNGRTFDRLESMGDAGYKRWTNAKWWSEGYSRLWENEDTPQSDTEAAPLRPTDGEKEDASVSVTTSSKVTQTVPKGNVVYLTADSEEELSELRPDETYIIGGICDHNRYKVTFYLSSLIASSTSSCLIWSEPLSK
jgi:tRNA (guanine9-N1)-methyltransferase